MEDPLPASEHLLEEIREQSAAEADEILKQAAEEKKRILAEAQSEAEKVRSEAVERAERTAESVRRKILSGVHLEVQRQYLDSREEVMSAVFDALIEKMARYRESKAYRSFLKRLVLEGVVALEGDAFSLVMGDVEKRIMTKKTLDETVRMIEESAGKKVRLTPLKRKLPEAGIVVVSSDERMLFDNRIATRIERMKDEIRLEVMNRVMA